MDGIVIYKQGQKARLRWVVVIDLTPKQKKNAELMRLISALKCAAAIKTASDDGGWGIPDRVILDAPPAKASSTWSQEIADSLNKMGLSARAFQVLNLNETLFSPPS